MRTAAPGPIGLAPPGPVCCDGDLKSSKLNQPVAGAECAVQTDNFLLALEDPGRPGLPGPASPMVHEAFSPAGEVVAATPKRSGSATERPRQKKRSVREGWAERLRMSLREPSLRRARAGPLGPPPHPAKAMRSICIRGIRNSSYSRNMRISPSGGG
jgi:hypothetical protein